MKQIAKGPQDECMNVDFRACAEYPAKQASNLRANWEDSALLDANGLEPDVSGLTSREYCVFEVTSAFWTNNQKKKNNLWERG